MGDDDRRGLTTDWVERTTVPATTELQAISAYPNRIERVIHAVLMLAGTVALVLASVLMWALLAGMVAVGDAVEDLGTSTECVGEVC